VNTSINGFYAAYITGSSQQGFALLVFRNGAVAGADVGGGKYDGTYTFSGLEKGFSVELKVSLPPNIFLVQGVTTGPQGDASEISFQLPTDFLSRPFVRINAKHGPVNVKIVKLRELNE
jgi:hypothetical protein